MPSPDIEGAHVDRIPIYDDTVPLTCTISGAEVPARVELIDRMRDRLDRIERTAHGLLLHFPARPDVDVDLVRFTVDEKRCCEFWGFAIDRAEAELALRWDGPPDAQDLLDELLAYFQGDEKLTAVSGLL